MLADMGPPSKTNHQPDLTPSHLMLLQEILGQIHVRVFWKDRELRYLGCNTLFAKDAGFSVPEDLIGKDDFQMAWREQAELYRADDLRVMTSGQPKLDFEEQQTTPDGHQIWLRTSKVPLRDGDGNIIGMLGMYDDVTARKQAMDALRTSEETLLEAQRIAQTGSWQLELATNKITWSHELYVMLGLDPSQPPPDQPEFSRILTPESWALLNKTYSELLSDGKPYEIELEIINKSADRGWILSRGETICDSSGNVIVIRGVSVNITRRKYAEEALLSSRDLLSKIVENIPIRVFWKDTESRYLGCNTAFANDAGSANPKDVIGKTDFQLAWHEQAELYRADDKQVMDSGVPKLGYEEPLTGPAGEAIWIRTSKVPILDAGEKIVGMLGIYEDITERKQSELDLHNANRALRAISACNEAMFRAHNETELLNATCALIVEIGEYRMAWIGYAQDNAEKSVKPMSMHGIEQGYLNDRKFSWDENSPTGRGPTGNAINTGKPQINQNFLNNPALGPWREAAIQRGYQSSIALPLAGTAGIFGALMIYAPEPDAFSAGEVALLEDLAKDLSFGIETLRTRSERDRIAEENQRYMVSQQQTLKDFVRVIASTVEMRDPYTAGHQYRVSQLAVAMGRQMGLSEHTISGLELAAMVHDVGQINVPAEILCRPGKLSDNEYLLIKQHPQTGYETLKDIQFPWPIATIVLQHHERLDGSGYPQGLQGDQIPLESRIMAVADVTEAMSSHRPYRPARTLDAVIDELQSGRGTRYDKSAVDACLTLLREKKFTFKY